MSDFVEEGLAILHGREDITRFGTLLHEAWQAKQSLSAKVSNPYVDELFEAAMDAGAMGGKLTGAGGGGFLLLFVPPAQHQKVREALRRLLWLPFEFEFAGSQIIFYTPERDYEIYERLREQQRLQPSRELDAAPRRMSRRAPQSRRRASRRAR
jgi:D-glycero-alpha-D-manno-heptose-7-phosphate kinase